MNDELLTLLTALIEEMKEINSNLLDISTSLSNLEQNLEDCTAHNGRNHFLCVTGNITNY